MFNWIEKNNLFELARQGKRITAWWLMLPIGIGILVLSPIFSTPVSITQIILQEVGNFGEEPFLAALFLSLNLALSFGGMIFLVWLWIKFFEKRSFATLGFLPRNALFQYARGFLVGFLSFLGTVGLIGLFGFIELSSAPVGLVGYAAIPVVLIALIPGWIIQGAAEEVLTRGWMLSALAARYKPWIGIMVSSLFFGLMHGLNPNLSILAMINLILYGLLAALYALREQSLWGICAFHSAWNWSQGNIFGMSVSGQELNTGYLFAFAEKGPAWFTGGAFGPEGGLASTLIMLIAITIILLWPQNKEQTVNISAEKTIDSRLQQN